MKGYAKRNRLIKPRPQKGSETTGSRATNSNTEDAVSGETALAAFMRQGIDSLRDDVLPRAIQQGGDPAYMKRVFEHIEALIDRE